MTLNVLQVIPHVGAGGAEQACVDIAAALVKRGDGSFVVSAGGRRLNEIEESGATHVLMKVASKNPFVMIKNAFRLARFIRENKINIIHVRSRAPAWSSYWASLMTSAVFVTTCHAVYSFESLFKKFYNSAMSKGDRVIAISDFVARHVKDNYPLKKKALVTILRGIDLKRFIPSSDADQRKESLLDLWFSENGLPKGKKIILLPGRLSRIKGQDLMIEAMAAMDSFLAAQYVLVIVGDDQGRQGYRDYLEKLVRDLGAQNRVCFVSHCSDMPTAYRLSDIVVVPSRVPEGFGRVPVEAMAMGLPVIASSLGATCETVLEGETGWLLPPEDPKAWARAVERAALLSSQERGRIEAKGQDRVRRFFSDEKMIADTLAVYDDVMKDRLSL